MTALAASAPAVAAQQVGRPDTGTARPRDDSVLHIGATVRVTSPAWGPDTVPGRVVRIVAPAGCLGILLVPHDENGRQVILFLPGLTSLQVDWRTNLGAYSAGISLPGASDWRTVPSADLARAEPGCQRRGGGRLAPGPRPD